MPIDILRLTVLAVLVQSIHILAAAERVDPVTEHPLLSAVLDIVVIQ